MVAVAKQRSSAGSGGRERRHQLRLGHVRTRVLVTCERQRTATRNRDDPCVGGSRGAHRDPTSGAGKVVSTSDKWPRSDSWLEVVRPRRVGRLLLGGRGKSRRQ